MQTVTVRSSDPTNRMETEHLAEKYLEVFDLAQLEDVSVKREDPRPHVRTPIQPPTEEWVHHPEEMTPRHPIINHRQQWLEDRKIQPLSPPPSEPTMYGPQPVLVNMALAGDPGTPPETPPVSHSPINTGLRPSTGLMDEMMWLPQQLRQDQQPLDLRPLHCMGSNPGVSDPEWIREREYVQIQHPDDIQQQAPFPYHHNIHNHHSGSSMHGLSFQSKPFQSRPLSVCSGGSAMSPRLNMNESGYSTCASDDLGISDDLLMKLSVRELNKRLHGFDKDDVMRLKQKRRTLKNRGYAQNCRSKRLQQKQDLETTNRTLQAELNRLKSELQRVLHERDMLKQRLHISHNNRGGPPQPPLNQQQNGVVPQQNNLNSDSQSSPEFYL
ncbi:transcription factor MafA [Chrysoperla carnea]|uniref:transcription factor MafA n=1 Tax=Chrysoperla carnea TaxID=189513 RepID=UPI001D0870A0|nr:transcription factor MafA [Chrysoperla carnea]